MTHETSHEITTLLGYEDEGMLKIEPISGGFTDAEKYVIYSPERPNGVFAKVVDCSNAVEVAVIDAEAQHYKVLKELGLTGTYFPEFYQYSQTDRVRVLFIEYFPDATWGGPWTEENIMKLLGTIGGVHALDVPEQQILKIQATSEKLMQFLYQESPNTLSEDDYARMFELGWSHDKLHVVNSRGQAYFKTTPEIYEAIKTSSSQFNKRKGKKIIVRDVNFGNIGIRGESVVFVDPAYLDIGNPAADMVGLGLNILADLPGGAESHALRELVETKFITDKKALARTVLSVIAVCTLDYGSKPENPWMDYHQKMADIALATWQKLFS